MLKLRPIIIGCTLAVAIGGTLATVQAQQKKPADSEIVFTINGTGVTAQEFAPLLQQEKALTVSHFQQKYNAEYGKDFWSRSYSGQTPLEYAKRQTIDKLTELKAEQILMQEQGIVEDISYEATLASLKRENEDRRQKISNNQPVYGPTQYGPAEYYSYSQSMNRQKWIDKTAEKAGQDQPDAVFRDYYEQIKANYFRKPNRFDYEKIRVRNDADDKSGAVTETLVLDPTQMSRDDQEAAQLYELFTHMQEGDHSEVYQTGEGAVSFKLLKIYDGGYESYDEVKRAVIQIYVQHQLDEQVSQFIRNATIETNSEVLDSIQFD